MKSVTSRAASLRFMRLILSVTLTLAFMVYALDTFAPEPAAAEELRPRHLGYGISVAPHLPSQPAKLNELGMDWVKIYDTSQLGDYPNQRVLYRIDMRRIDPAWEQGLPDLIRTLVGAGVDAVELGNEPNLGVEWESGPPNPEEFAAALCGGYRVIKSVAPQMVVVAGGLAPTAGTGDGLNMDDFVFARRMFAAGAGNCFDAYAYHPYGFNQSPEADPYAQPFSFRRAERMYQLLWDFGIRDKQMWITEFGWVRNPAEESLDCAEAPEFIDFNWMAFSSEVQAGYTARAFRFAEENWPWAGPMFLWNLDWGTYNDYGYESACSHLRWYGILRKDGSPLPVYNAVQQLQKRSPLEYRPFPGAVVDRMTTVAEAGCASEIEQGSFTVLNAGHPGVLNVDVIPANAPGRPVISTNISEAHSRDEVTVMVDASGVDPGLYLIAVNLRSQGGRQLTSHVVRGWLFLTFPRSPECIQAYNNG